MKKFVLAGAAVLVAFALFAGIRSYQWRQLSSEQKAAHFTDRLEHKLHLSTEQKEKVYALNLDKVRKFEAAKSAGKFDRAAFKAEKEAWKTEMRNILNEEQLKKWD